MPVPSLPKVGAPPAPATLRKIALEEHFGHPVAFMRDSDGRFETRQEAAVCHLGPEYFELAQKRLPDFDTTRLQAMDEAGVDKVLLFFGAGFLTFGADRILFSNDCPYEDYAEGGEFTDTVAISEGDRRKIAYDNAKALYRL